jgi:two-component system response regulator HydG
LHETYPDLLSIVLTGRGGLDVAVSAMRAGAYDYISKPVAIAALEVAVTRALLHLSLQRELADLRTRVEAPELDGVVGNSDAIRRVIELVHRVAPTDATVLITGESGTGKELVARMLHRESPRQHEPFVALNCAAMPASLLESELFGHVRGAFTSASHSRPGLFVQAGRGTIFLDELGEMPLEMQVKLLRVLQERTVRAVGSDEEVPIAARVIASTNRDLETMVAEKRFREDLYYRVNVVAIAVPPLRMRDTDALLLAHFFLHRTALRAGKPVVGITAPAARLISQYDWPGNVRELENVIERAVALCRLDQLTVDDLPSKLNEHPATFVVPCTLPSELVTLAEMQRRYVRQVLTLTGGNKAHAARVLGIDRRSVYRRLDGQNS